VKYNTFTWINSGAYLYSYCNFANVIEGMIMAAQNGENGEIYFLMDSYPIQFKEFITRLLATQNLDCSHIKSVSTWYGNAVSWFQRTSGVSLSYSDIAISSALKQILLISDKKARSKLGYKSLVSLEKGLEEMRENFILQLKTPRSHRTLQK
jgi:nucleoside-diphosphate-sugar epimerase